MKPTITVQRIILEQGDLCKIILNARTEMINAAGLKAREQKKTAFESSQMRSDADRLAIKMAERCMHVNSMHEALEIVKEYVNIEIS